MPRISDGPFAIGCLFAGFVWIFVVLPFLYYPRQDTPQGDGQAAQSEGQAAHVSRPPPSLVPLKIFTSAGRNEIAAYCASQAEKEKDQWARNYICDIKITDTYLAVFNFLLVVVTGGLIFTSWRTIEKMRDTEERQLRAYVFAEPEAFQNLRQPIPSSGAGLQPYRGITGYQRKISYVIVFRNSGQTPAYKFQQFTSVDVFDEPAAEAKFAAVKPQSEAPISRATLAAGATARTTGEVPISEEENVAIRDGLKGFYVYGEIGYVDAFRRPRRARFRLVHRKGVNEQEIVYAEDGNEEIDSS